MTDLLLLRAAGTALLLDLDCALDDGPGVPTVLHWGADLGDLDGEAQQDVALALLPPLAGGAADVACRPSMVPTEADGWPGRPGLAGHRPGGGPAPRLHRTEPVSLVERPDGGTELTVVTADAEAGVRVVVHLHLEPSGVVRTRQSVTATSAAGWSLAGSLALLPVPSVADEVLDLTGRWCRERAPQRGPLLHGSRVRESRRGRTGHDAATLMVAGTRGFGFRSGQVWGAHVAWSGDHVHLVERFASGDTMLGGGELLLPGEVELAEGETYESPWTVLVWSDEGLDGATERLHRFVRARDGHPSSPRPLVLNTWEAVYFDHDLARLTELAETAAQVGVERFVLDDGWFLGRRDDTAGLGDWTVDPQVWPQGLHPLFDRVRALGLQVGLWVEPEMVNLDSDLVRAHPDWLLSAPGRLPLPWRNQYVVDLARPEVFDHLLARLDSLVSEYRPDYLKWDHNRDLHEATHAGRPGVHEQTSALYRLLDALRAKHPGLEIESCASGGGRVDLGILERTDRVWASDTNDAVERQQIQRWTGLLLPPELVGAHVGPPRAHTTGRVVDLGLRLLTSLFGHAGIEWDITTCTPEELARLRAWTALYRELRPLLHTGTTVRGDLPDDDALLHGVVAPDRSHAVFAYVRLASGALAVDGPVRLPGLDPDRSYRVRLRTELADPPGRHAGATAWTERAEGVVLTGRALAGAGLAVPVLTPASGILVEVMALEAAAS